MILQRSPQFPGFQMSLQGRWPALAVAYIGGKVSMGEAELMRVRTPVRCPEIVPVVRSLQAPRAAWVPAAASSWNQKGPQCPPQVTVTFPPP